MSNRQLETVLKLESDREKSAASRFYDAQIALNEQQQKLFKLEQYRVDYIEQIKRSNQKDIKLTDYQQHLSFIGKLDLACEQQQNTLSQFSLIADEKKRYWLKQQQRKKAVQLLLDKKIEQLRATELRQEQYEMDEFANQRFLRNRMSN